MSIRRQLISLNVAITKKRLFEMNDQMMINTEAILRSTKLILTFGSVDKFVESLNTIRSKANKPNRTV
jgi:hypothetical protein